jgi:hypothetical protein
MQKIVYISNNGDEDKHLPIMIDLSRKATILRPDVASNWEFLAGHFLLEGKYEEAIAVLNNASSKLPTNSKVHLLLAMAYYRARQFERSREILDDAPPVPTDDRETKILRLELLIRLAARKNELETSIASCQDVLELDPGHTRARYELAIALAMLGRSDEACQLIDLDQFVTVTDLATPAGYENAKAFEAALVSEISRNPTLRPDPPGKATKSGFQTSANLPRAGEQAISTLLSVVQSTVDRFEEGLKERLDHPFVAGRPKRARLKAWAVVYPGDGYQTPHIHPSGWLSGVYYVSMPERCSDDLNTGHLVLGTFERAGLTTTPPWGTRNILPVPGRLVMFPSYVPHATIPTRSAAERICISFDVVPVRDVPNTGA